MNIGNDVKKQIWDTVLAGYKIYGATDAVKELNEAYCELYGIKDNNDSQLVKRFFELDDVADGAIKLALNGKNVCITASRMHQKSISKRVLQKNNLGYISHEYAGVVDEIYFKCGGSISFMPFDEDNFTGREFHNAFIYMQNIDTDDCFYNTYGKLVQRCRLK